MPATKKGTRTPANGSGKLDTEKVAALEAEAAVPVEEVVHDAEREAQARYEGVEIGESITFFDRRYRLAPKIGLMPLLDFAHESSKGANTDDEKAMTTMRDMLWRCFMQSPPCRRCEACAGRKPNPDGCTNREDGDDGPCGICGPCAGRTGDPETCESYDPGDWPAFHLAALDNAADEVDLLSVVTQVIQAVTARPTRRRSGFSPVAPNGSPRSKAGSSGRREPDGMDGLVAINDLVR